MVRWFRRGEGTVAILDATNSTKERRRWIQERCVEEGIATMFVESCCNDQSVVMANIMEVKTTSPDYKGQDPEEAVNDFLERIRKYNSVYEPLGDDEKHLTHVKIIDIGAQVIINNIRDYLQSRMVYYLMNLHIRPRSIWLSRVRICPDTLFVAATDINPARRI